MGPIYYNICMRLELNVDLVWRQSRSTLISCYSPPTGADNYGREVLVLAEAFSFYSKLNLTAPHHAAPKFCIHGSLSSPSPTVAGPDKLQDITPWVKQDKSQIKVCLKIVCLKDAVKKQIFLGRCLFEAVYSLWGIAIYRFFSVKAIKNHNG